MTPTSPSTPTDRIPPTRPISANPGPPGLFNDSSKEQELFDQYFWDEDLCIRFVVDRLYPNGFSCRRCGFCRWGINDRKKKLIACCHCGREVWILKNTIFNRTKLPLTTWFRGAFLLRFRGVNASSLGRMLKLVYNTSWLLTQKLRYAMGILHRVPRCGDTAVDWPPLQLYGHRNPESLRLHGCERLQAPDFADRTDLGSPYPPPEGRRAYPWKRWLTERGPFPDESRFAHKVRDELSWTFNFSIGERYLQLYLDEYAYRFDRLALGVWRTFKDLADALPLTRPRTRRELGNLPARRPVRPWLSIRERTGR